jgi:hypothetical protein
MEWKQLFAIHTLFKKEGIETTKLKFGEVKTADGKYVLVYNGDDVLAGQPLKIITDEGEIAAPEGEHTLEDGRVVVIEGIEGIVKEVKEKAAEPVEPAAPAQNPEPAPEERMSKEEVSRVIEERVRKFEDEQKSKFEQQNEIINGLYSIVKKISDAPAQAPASNTSKPEKKEFSAQEEIKALGDKLVSLINKK